MLSLLQDFNVIHSELRGVIFFVCYLFRKLESYKDCLLNLRYSASERRPRRFNTVYIKDIFVVGPLKAVGVVFVIDIVALEFAEDARVNVLGVVIIAVAVDCVADCVLVFRVAAGFENIDFRAVLSALRGLVVIGPVRLNPECAPEFRARVAFASYLKVSFAVSLFKSDASRVPAGAEFAVFEI